MYECPDCDIRWMNGIVHSDTQHICKLCGRDCSRNTSGVKGSTQKTHWIVHKGKKYTEGSFMGYFYRTKEEAQKKLDEIREDNIFNIAEIDGEYDG